jgi:hypothetical protein
VLVGHRSIDSRLCWLFSIMCSYNRIRHFLVLMYCVGWASLHVLCYSTVLHLIAPSGLKLKIDLTWLVNHLTEEVGGTCYLDASTAHPPTFLIPWHFSYKSLPTPLPPKKKINKNSFVLNFTFIFFLNPQRACRYYFFQEIYTVD